MRGWGEPYRASLELGICVSSPGAGTCARRSSGSSFRWTRAGISSFPGPFVRLGARPGRTRPRPREPEAVLRRARPARHPGDVRRPALGGDREVAGHRRATSRISSFGSATVARCRSPTRASTTRRASRCSSTSAASAATRRRFASWLAACGPGAARADAAACAGRVGRVPVDVRPTWTRESATRQDGCSSSAGTTTRRSTVSSVRSTPSSSSSVTWCGSRRISTRRT